MHVYILTRGIKNLQDQFITELQGKYLPYRFPNPKTKELETFHVQVGVRPIQLFEIVFPEEHKDIMLRTILSGDGKPLIKSHKKWIWALRKALGVEPIPEFQTKGEELPLQKANVDKIGIGIKKDYWQNVEGKKFYNPTSGEKEKYKLFEGL